MARTLSVECVSSWINLLSLYYGSLLSSFLGEAKNPHLVAVPGTHLRPGTWPFSPAPYSFLQHLFWCPTWDLKGHNLDLPFGLWLLSGTWLWLVLSCVDSSSPLGSGRDQFSGHEGAHQHQGFSPLDLSHSPIALSLWTWEDPPRRPLDIQIKTTQQVLTTRLGEFPLCGSSSPIPPPYLFLVPVRFRDAGTTSGAHTGGLLESSSRFAAGPPRVLSGFMASLRPQEDVVGEHFPCGGHRRTSSTPERR